MVGSPKCNIIIEMARPDYVQNLLDKAETMCFKNEM